MLVTAWWEQDIKILWQPFRMTHGKNITGALLYCWLSIYARIYAQGVMARQKMKNYEFRAFWFQLCGKNDGELSDDVDLGCFLFKTYLVLRKNAKTCYLQMQLCVLERRWRELQEQWKRTTEARCVCKEADWWLLESHCIGAENWEGSRLVMAGKLGKRG